MELNIVIAFVLGLLLLYLVGRVMVVPIKLIMKLLVNGIVGGLVLGSKLFWSIFKFAYTPQSGHSLNGRVSRHSRNSIINSNSTDYCEIMRNL